MASLVLTSGDTAGKYFPIANRPLSIGRDPARDIQLADPKVSRKHCLIRRRGDDYVIQPFQSVNPVLVNGIEVHAEVVLNEGDEIELGETTLCFRFDDDPNRTNALERRKLADRRMREDPTLNEL